MAWTAQQLKMIDPIWDFIESNESYSIEQLFEVVRGISGIKVKNWLRVREVMQAINDELGYARTDDIHNEIFAKVAK